MNKQTPNPLFIDEYAEVSEPVSYEKITSMDERGEPNWQAYDMFDAVAANIDVMVFSTSEMHDSVAEAVKDRVLLDEDDLTRIVSEFGKQLSNMWVYREQFDRWKNKVDGLSLPQLVLLDSYIEKTDLLKQQTEEVNMGFILEALMVGMFFFAIVVAVIIYNPLLKKYGESIKGVYLSAIGVISFLVVIKVDPLGLRGGEISSVAKVCKGPLCGADKALTDFPLEGLLYIGLVLSVLMLCFSVYSVFKNVNINVDAKNDI